jgi:hypothetical protein
MQATGTLDGHDIQGQVRALEERYPEVGDRIDPKRLARQQMIVRDLEEQRDAFGAAAMGGRGEAYIRAQDSTLIRAHGIGQLMNIFTARGRAESELVIDLLGGDGLVSRVMALLGKPRPQVVTCDASPFMGAGRLGPRHPGPAATRRGVAVL